jgi:hypothetical protein
VGTGSSSCGVNLLGNEAPSTVEAKTVWSHTSKMMRPIFKAGCSVVSFKIAKETKVALKELSKDTASALMYCFIKVIGHKGRHKTSGRVQIKGKYKMTM